jgi:NADH-quinone oxidoreductase subunit G
LAGTARAATAHISAGRAAALAVSDGDSVKISTERGSTVLPVVVDEIAGAAVWIPRNSEGSQAIATLGNVGGVVVSVVKA